MPLHFKLLAAAVCAALSCHAQAAAPLKFAFGPAAAPPGFTQVAAGTTYAAARGYGYEPDGTANYFSVDLPEGNYAVTVTLGGDKAQASTTTIKSELRRLMLENIQAKAGELVTRTFIVNVRTPDIAAVPGVAAGVVNLKQRERENEAWNWDRRLTLELSGTPGAVRRIEIAPASVPTLFLLGDSTVCDQPGEPYASWGQMLPRFLQPGIAVANHAQSGETYRDAIGRRRLDKIVSVLKPGDTVLMQFGHNDQKQIKDGRSGPFSTYKAEIKTHVDAVRARGGLPVIVSPVERRAFDTDGTLKFTLRDYVEAAGQAARELNVPFIDLNAMSRTLYQALGEEGSKAAFALPASGKLDNTHHDSYGAWLLAQAVGVGMRQAGIPAASQLVPGFQFDPAHPLPVASFSVPPSPRRTEQRPLGDDAGKDVRTGTAQ